MGWLDGGKALHIGHSALLFQGNNLRTTGAEALGKLLRQNKSIRR